MLPAEKVINISVQGHDSEPLIVTWTNAIRADAQKESLKVGCAIGDDAHTIEAKLHNEDGILHTLAFLRKYPEFNVNVLMHQCNEDALQWSLLNGSPKLTQLLLEHSANPNTPQRLGSRLSRIHAQLIAYRNDTSEYIVFFALLHEQFKEQMELGRAKLELMLCYGYRPSKDDIKKIYEHYTIDPREFAPTQNESTKHGTEYGITSTVSSFLENIPLIGRGVKFLRSGIELYHQRQSHQERSLPEPIYDKRQFITPVELSFRLQTAIKDIEEREKNNPLAKQAASVISEGMGNVPMPLANLVYQYSDIVLKARGQIFDQRKAEGATIAFRYTLRPL